MTDSLSAPEAKDAVGLSVHPEERAGGVLLLNRADTRVALDPMALLPSLVSALVAISRGDASAPSRVAATSPAGLLGAMPAYVPGLGMVGKLTSVFPQPGDEGRSTHRGVVLQVDEVTGEPIAVMDAEPVTAIRTAATATIAMQALARQTPQRIAVIGAGTQARSQLRMLAAIRSTASVVVASRHRDRAVMAASDHPGVTAVQSVREAVEAADVVFCCTDARTPVVDHGWLAPGAHLSSVGGSHGPELDQFSITEGSLFVEWPGAATELPPAGAHELIGTDPAQATMLGAVLDGAHPGRRSDTELTVFKSTGHAALDVAAAVSATRRARELGIGSRVDW